MTKGWLTLLSLILASILPCFAQQSGQNQGSLRSVVGQIIDGSASVDGTQIPTATSIFENDVVSTSAAHLSVVNEGNTLIFASNSNFKALTNAYKLNSGGSKVATRTGMTAYLPNCYSVTPVDPLLTTTYEVNWSGSAVWVYARSHDVRINYWKDGDAHPPESAPDPRPPDQGWIVKEGHLARLRQVKLCKPILDWWDQPNLPTGWELAGTVGTVASEPFWFQNLSSSSPEQ